MAKKENFNHDKITLFWFSAGFFLVLMFAYSIYFSYPSGDEVKLIIDFGDGNERTFMTNYRPGITAWGMLQQANAIYGLPLSIENHFEPRAIGEKENGEDGKRWNFYLNGRPAKAGPFESSLSGGEVILFKFE